MSDEPKSTENWNMATSTLKRFSSLMDSSCASGLQEDFVNLYKSLWILRKQVIPFTKPDEEKEIREMFAQLPSGWRIGKAVNPKCQREVHKILDDIEIKLLRIMKREGLLMPKSDDPNRAILG